MPPCSEPGPIQHETDLLVAPEACCMSEDGAGKTRRGWPKIWRAHSDGMGSEKVDGANECPAQPYGDSKSPLEVDNMDHPAPSGVMKQLPSRCSKEDMRQRRLTSKVAIICR